MRDIKFKVFCEKHNREEIYTLGDLICGEAISKNGEGGIFKNWSQYTGLHDKNGVEIYEGDILKNDKYEYLVRYIGTRFEARKQEYRRTEISIQYWKKCEIVGNIHDKEVV